MPAACTSEREKRNRIAASVNGCKLLVGAKRQTDVKAHLRRPCRDERELKYNNTRLHRVMVRPLPVWTSAQLRPRSGRWVGGHRLCAHTNTR